MKTWYRQASDKDDWKRLEETFVLQGTKWGYCKGHSKQSYVQTLLMFIQLKKSAVQVLITDKAGTGPQTTVVARRRLGKNSLEAVLRLWSG